MIDRFRPLLSLTLTLLNCSLALHANGQSAPAAPSPANAAPSNTKTTAGSDQDALADFRPALLREGSRLVEARGQMHRDAETGWWKLRVESSTPVIPASTFDLVLLPSTMLSEMQHVVESTPNQQVTFEVTGEVFVFRGRNFLMPVHAPKLVAHEPTTAKAATTSAPAPAPPVVPQATTSTATTATATTTTSAPQSPIKSGDTAEDIMHNLQQSIGSVPRNIAEDQPRGQTPPQGKPDAATNPAGASGPGTSPPGELASDKSLPSATAGASRPEKLLQEGTAIISRRGKLTRDPAGGWLFVFDADATGLVDPPVRLLPCLLLETLEDYARHNGSTAPILISGQVYVYNGRNYLLPTVYRIPRDRTKITP